MNNEAADAVAEALFGCVDDVTRIGLRIGWYAVRSVFGSSGGSRQQSEGERHEAALNQMIQRGEFYQAKQYVANLNLDYSTQTKIIAQLEEMEAEWKQMAEWNAKLNHFLQSGDVDGALRYVNSLHLPYDRRQEICNQIRAAVRQQEERQRQAEIWGRELSNLLSGKKYKQARKYVEALPIEKRAREMILAQLPKPSWLWG
jgi:hypothetical protein